jgi:histidyl-tRNA synthetase
MTKGRKREHYQWNMDIWGIKHVTAEAELISSLVTFFQNIGMNSSQVQIKVSSRKILQIIIDSLNISNDKFAQCCVIVDKLDKLTNEEVIEQLLKIEVEEKAAKEMISILSVKSIDELEQQLKSNNDAIKELKTFFDLIESYGIKDWVKFDASIVRGLSYYTGIVFEAFPTEEIQKKSGLKRAICGGGRYDKILSIYKAKQDIEACGFGFGDCVIIELLSYLKLIPDFKKRNVQDIVVPFDESFRGVAIEVLTKLRMTKRTADIILGMKEGNNKRINLNQAYSYADRIGASRVILIAPDEWKEKKVRVKFLKESTGKDDQSSNEITISLEDLLKL